MQQAQQRQETVKTAEQTSRPANAVNQYVRQFKHDMANGKVPKGKYTLPAAALISAGIAGFAAAPVTGTAGMVGGYVGDKAVNFGMKHATGKAWADWLSSKTGLDMEAAAMTNPGMWAGGYYVPKYGTNVTRRGVETAMRTSSM